MLDTPVLDICRHATPLFNRQSHFPISTPTSTLQAVHFAREGADVAILYLPEEDKDAAETEALVQKEGRKCLLLSGDVGSHDVRRASRGQLGDGLGPLAGVIAGALAAGACALACRSNGSMAGQN
jgi:NAD(P)-dependent dehydrogenase (short-subunit alcohol dehydrogenase family)